MLSFTIRETSRFASEQSEPSPPPFIYRTESTAPTPQKQGPGASFADGALRSGTDAAARLCRNFIRGGTFGKEARVWLEDGSCL